MIIPVHSNVASGLYVVIFETVIPLILCSALQTYIYAYNLHVIHNSKNSLRLTTTRLSAVTGFGITSKRNARLTSLLGCASLILTILGSFSIDGVSRMATKEVTMPLFLSVANRSSDVIDFTRHVSADGSRVSATFLLASMATGCFRRNETHGLLYPSVGDLEDIDGIDRVIYTNRFRRFNLSCTLDDQKFVHVQHYSQRTIDLDRNETQCSINNSLNVGNSSLWQDRSAFRCSGIEVIETWCASYLFFTCVAHFRTDVGHSFMYIIPRAAGSDTELEWTFLAVSSSRAIYSQTVKSAAYLLATGAGRFEMLQVSKMSLKRNVPVEIDDEEVFETEVSVPLFLCTAGVVTVSTIMVCLVALFKWRQNVLKNGLRGKNGYNSAMDVIMLAAKMVVDEEAVASNDDVVVGVSGGEPRVGPMSETNIGGTEFEEQEVKGRLRRRKNELVLRVTPVDAEREE